MKRNEYLRLFDSRNGIKKFQLVQWGPMEMNKPLMYPEITL